MRIAYLFTTFPKLSERFFLREVQELREQGLHFEVFSMFGGQDDPAAGRVVHFRGAEYILVFAELLVWMVRRPIASSKLLSMLNPFYFRSMINWAENALGLAFAFRFARSFSDSEVVSHATWATAPAMAAYAINALTGIEYTMEAHAYDIYRDGGDAHLVKKLKGARRVRTSTESAANEVLSRLGDLSVGSSRVFCVRRGLTAVPAFRELVRKEGSVFRFLSVGRLIEKKGYLEQLHVLLELRNLGLHFRAKIIGGGPLEPELRREVQLLGLSQYVQVAGKQEHEAVDAAYEEADALLFYGRVSSTGDRDGFPNVIGEAMSHSLPVFSTRVAGTTEVIKDGVTGFLLDGADALSDAQKLKDIANDLDCLRTVATNAHGWVQESFAVAKNVSRLKRELWG